jgi:phosphate transport system substrate-binding protein
MKSRFLTITAVSSVILLMSVATIFAETKDTTVVIRVKGANSMANLIDSLAKQFMQSNPGTRIIVSGGGTDAGFEALFDKNVELVMASRKIYVKERQAAMLSGINPAEITLRKDALVFVTRPDNSVSEISAQQLLGLYTGELKNWSALGGPNEPILALATPQISGTALTIRAKVLQGGLLSSDCRFVPYFHRIAQQVRGKSQLAIGYMTLGDAEKAQKSNTVKILGIKKDKESPAVMASAQTLKDGSYPVLMIQYLYWDQTTGGEHVKKFIDFCVKHSAESL